MNYSSHVVRHSLGAIGAAAALVHSTKVTETGTDGPFLEILPAGTLDSERIQCSKRPSRPSFS